MAADAKCPNLQTGAARRHSLNRRLAGFNLSSKPPCINENRHL